jgi:hypothetical protein
VICFIDVILSFLPITIEDVFILFGGGGGGAINLGFGGGGFIDGGGLFDGGRKPNILFDFF